LGAVKLSQLEWLNGCMWVITHVKSCQRLIFSLCRQQRRSPSSASCSKWVAALGGQGQGSQSTREAVSGLCRPLWSPDQDMTRILLTNNNCRVIPEWTQIALHTYSIHRDARYFHTPDAFLPERWFSKGTPAEEHNPAAFFPFSYGPTICAGKNMALMEMRMVLCWILRHFCFFRAPGVVYEEWEAKIQDWFVVHQEPLLVSVSLRK
jgi:hypothetical protein